MALAAVLRDGSAEINHAAFRIEAQLDCAELVREYRPGKAVEGAIEKAQQLAQAAFATAEPGVILGAVPKIEAALAPVSAIAKTLTLYCVGHAHIDMNWMWGWPETVALTHDTMATVLKLMEEFPTFVFSQSQASIYRIVEEYNPEMLAAIRQRVREGRWEVTASHWVEGDRNMVSGESLTRHLLYTRRYLKEIFDLDPEDVRIDWAPDTFGHPQSVPMYLTRGGVRWVYLHRPGEVGPVRPEAFWWKSPDGARVLVRNDMANGYNGEFNHSTLASLRRFVRDTKLPFGLHVYGVGDHGGGPTRRDLAMAVEMDTWPCYPNVKLARAAEFYTRLEKEGGKLPTLDCELNFEVAGCYTTQALIKRSNRIAEHRLLDAEVASVVSARASGRASPTAALEGAWRDTLFSHFHDILPGSNVRDSRTWMHGLFQKTMATTSMIETRALRALAAEVDTQVKGVAAAVPGARSLRAVLGAGSGAGSAEYVASQGESVGGGPRALMVFNPVATERREIIEALVWTDARAGITEEIRQRPLRIRTPEGALIEPQKIEVGHYWGHVFVRIAFPVVVPPLGYATYTVLEEAATGVSLPAGKQARQITPPYHCVYLTPDRQPQGLVNEFLRVQIDPLTGGIKRLEDLRAGVTLAPEEPWGLEYALEKPHGMSAWIADNIIGQENPQVLTMERRLDGPYKATLEVKLRIRQSDFTLVYELRAGDPRLYIHLTGMWMERGTPQVGVPSLRYKLGLPLTDIQTTYEIPFGVIRRDLAEGQEVPALNFAMISGRAVGGGAKAAGLLVLNDCKHGHSLDGSTFRMTLIRSAYEPDPLPDVGQHEIHLALLPFGQAPSAAEAVTQGKTFNRPVRVITTGLHGGKLPAVASAVRVQGAGVVLSELKAAEAGDGLVIRLVNPGRGAARAKVSLDGQLLGKIKTVTALDLMEGPAAGKVTVAGQTFSVIVPGGALVSVKVT